MARPGRLELPTLCLEGRRSIQLSYGRVVNSDSKTFRFRSNTVLDEFPSVAKADARRNRVSCQVSQIREQYTSIQVWPVCG
jgi:hypothetical protein